MKGAIKLYGLIVLTTVIAIFVLNINQNIISKDETFNAVRATQLSTIEESINIGELIVNNMLSIDEDIVKGLWLESFERNVTTTTEYKVNFVAINNTPPAIAIMGEGVDEYHANKDELTFNYSNLVIIERGINE